MPRNRPPAEDTSSYESRRGESFIRTMRELQRWMRELRQMHGLTHSELHARTKIDRDRLVAIERDDDINPKLNTLARIADALGLEAHELFNAPASGIRPAASAHDQPDDVAPDEPSGPEDTLAERRTRARFRARLQELRALHDLSFRELHERSGVNWRQLIAMSQGEAPNPTLVTLTRLADAFHIPVHELIGPRRATRRPVLNAPATVATLPVRRKP